MAPGGGVALREASRLGLWIALAGGRGAVAGPSLGTAHAPRACGLRIGWWRPSTGEAVVAPGGCVATASAGSGDYPHGLGTMSSPCPPTHRGDPDTVGQPTRPEDPGPLADSDAGEGPERAGQGPGEAVVAPGPHPGTVAEVDLRVRSWPFSGLWREAIFALWPKTVAIGGDRC